MLDPEVGPLLGDANGVADGSALQALLNSNDARCAINTAQRQLRGDAGGVYSVSVLGFS